MSQWQPIETAPRDGTRVLLAYPHQPRSKQKWGTVRVGKFVQGTWHFDMAGHFRVDCTHWMPLPEPPSIDPM